MKKFFLFLFLLFVYRFYSLHCVAYPNTVDYAVEMTFTQQILNEGDKVGFSSSADSKTVYGILWPAGGFDVQKNSSAGEVIFGCPVFIDKVIGLDEEVYLNLSEDLMFANGAFLSGSGVINSQGGGIVLSGSFDLQSYTITFTAYTIRISGCGNVIDFSKGGKFIKARNGDIQIESCYLKGIQENSILFDNHNENLYLRNTVLQLDNDFAANFNLIIDGDVLITGTHIFCVNRELNLLSGSRLILDVGTTFSMGYPASVPSDISSVKNTGVIHFNGCNIEIGDNYGTAADINNGFYLKEGKVVFQNEVHIDDDDKRKFFQIADTADTYFLAGARVILDGTTTLSLGGSYL
ncbi:hypothetical protein GF385_04775 [Candidatus Dependentiae bacterium]|nr:hypothetical protein [Candidatus Dependentiae bacterium]